MPLGTGDVRAFFQRSVPDPLAILRTADNRRSYLGPRPGFGGVSGSAGDRGPRLAMANRALPAIIVASRAVVTASTFPAASAMLTAIAPAVALNIIAGGNK